MREVIEKEYGKEGRGRRAAHLQDQVDATRRKRTRPSGPPPPPSCRRDVEGKIDPDQFKLYSLIWKRAMASQMAHALFDTVAVDMVPSKQAEAGDGAADVTCCAPTARRS